MAVVTGGTRGIGLAICKRLRTDGIRVVALYVSNEDEASYCRNAFGIMTVRCDVGEFSQCEETVREVERSEGPVDILVNNAGIARDCMLHKMTEGQWNEVIRINLNGVFNMTRQVISGMRDRGYGRIINISSINGQKGQFGQANYSAAKAGIIGFTKALAQESIQRGVTVNAVAPGYTATDMVAAVSPAVLKAIEGQIPAGRLGRPEEIAHCVAFLAGEEAGFITGATFAINGGQHMMG